MRTMRTNLALILMGAAAMAGCDEGVGPAGGEQVAVAFRSAGMVSAATPAADGMAVESIDVTGSNGTLRIDELRIIVAEFELDRLDDQDCVEDDDACEKFEAPPAFVNVPLDGGTEVSVTATVEPDTYDELEFEIEDLDDDEEDPREAELIAELFEAIRSEFPDWPREASMLVVGSFTPEGGEPEPFRVFFDAEVEIELDLDPPVTVDAAGDGATFTVTIDPSLWFTNGDGTVRNLALVDFDETGDPVEFEVEMENGFAEVEHDDD